MFIVALVAFAGAFTQRFSFGIVGENITLNIRKAMYESILKKHIGFHDSKDNAAGILTAALASEAQTLNGASTEGLAIMLESGCAVICGLTIGFIFSWKISLVAIGCLPFMMVAGYFNGQIHKGHK